MVSVHRSRLADGYHRAAAGGLRQTGGQDRGQLQQAQVHRRQGEATLDTLLSLKQRNDVWLCALRFSHIIEFRCVVGF